METLGYILLAYLIFRFGRWRGARRSTATARRAYIAGMQDALITDEEITVPQSREVEDWDRRLS